MNGYEVVHLTGYLDMFLVQKELLDGLDPPPFTSFANKGASMHHCVVTPDRRGHWIEIKTYILSDGDMELAQAAAREQALLLYSPASGYSGSPDCFGFDQGL
jgi:hypothetical protein